MREWNGGGGVKRLGVASHARRVFTIRSAVRACHLGQELAGYSADPACLQGKKLCTDSSCSLLDSIVINVCFKTGLGPLCNFGVNYGAHDCDTQV